MAERKPRDVIGRRVQPIGTDDEEADVRDDDVFFAGSPTRGAAANEASRGFHMKPHNTSRRERNARRRVQPLGSEEGQSDEARDLCVSSVDRVQGHHLEVKVRASAAAEQMPFVLSRMMSLGIPNGRYTPGEPDQLGRYSTAAVCFLPFCCTSACMFCSIWSVRLGSLRGTGST